MITTINRRDGVVVVVVVAVVPTIIIINVVAMLALVGIRVDATRVIVVVVAVVAIDFVIAFLVIISAFLHHHGNHIEPRGSPAMEAAIVCALPS